MIVLVCGSRRFSDPFRVSLAIDEFVAALEPGSVVIHGAAAGADRIAAEAAERHGLTVWDFPADWEAHGRRAGVLRNLQMLDEKPDAVVAFYNGESPGTAHTIREARKRGIPVEVIPCK